jgi:beta-aspartyl-peptidase (threonine type)
MRDESSSGGGFVAVVIGVILVLLLLLGGGALAWRLLRQPRALTQQAEAAEMQARLARDREVFAREQAQRDQAADGEPAPAASAVSDDLLSPAGADAPTEPAETADARKAILAVLQVQQQAWNRGDVEAFADHYWHSDELSFSSGGKTTRGWQATVDRYRQRYPTPEAMGQLAFDELEVTPLGRSAALVLGRWRLDREGDPQAGNFSLVFRKIDGRWVIVHDHTSVLAE